MRHALIVASLIVLASCGGGGSPPTAPSQNRIAAGTWEGPFTTDVGALTGSLKFVLSQDASGSITGTSTLTVPGLTVPDGSVTGGIQPNANPPTQIGFAIVVAGSCPATLSAPSTLTTLTTIEGVVAGGNPACNLDVRGRFTLQKRP
jgi:hypothetical protein